MTTNDLEEWALLIQEALKQGLTPEEIKSFLSNYKNTIQQ
jgi:DNA-binding transcriptional MerR regulator